MDILQIILALAAAAFMLWGYTLIFLHALCIFYIMLNHIATGNLTAWYYDKQWFRNGFSISKTWRRMKYYRSNI